MDLRNAIAGCMIGGAVGDALGAPVEFNSIAAIRAGFGPAGVTSYAEFTDGRGAFTDDTQMALFTAEGALRAYHRSEISGTEPEVPAALYRSYLRWLRTQEGPAPAAGRAALVHGERGESGWLMEEPLLYRRRAPGTTCLAALRSGRMGTPEKPINNSKGCGGIMRVAPIPLLFRGERFPADRVLSLGCASAAITHGHPSGYWSAGCLGLILHHILLGCPLREAVAEACGSILPFPGHEETLAAVRNGIEAAGRKHFTPEDLEEIGGGWTGEEALGISVACALRFHDDFEAGVLSAVNHSGDSDSTGSITGNILGLLLGRRAISSELIDNLEGVSIVEEVADDLFIGMRGSADSPDAEWLGKYPCVDP